MSPSETTKLTAELKDLSATVQTPDWGTVDELVAMRHEIVTTTAGKEHRRTLNFQQSVELYKSLDAEKSRIEAQMKDIKVAVEAAVLVSGVEKVKVGDWRCNRIEKKGSRKIVPEKLLAQGVAPEVIANATEIGKGSSYVDIRRASDKE